jgi:hypothetical protein
MDRPRVICLTPVLNEAWILERFLKCASLWADHIIIADQQSTDGSREIAKSFPKVTMLDNPAQKFNEPERQQMLIAEARKIPGPRLLLALDADEFLTSTFLTSPEWQMILHAPAGTSISFQWPMVRKDGTEFNQFLLLKEVTVGFVDDGTEHQGNVIHSTRVPKSPGGRTLHLKDIGLMHYCMMDHDRFDSRLRWYQCWELLNATKRPFELYRFYHTDLFVPPNMITPVPPEWIQGYEQGGIDMTTVKGQGIYRWDKEVMQFFDEHGTEKFKRLAIWDTDWSRLYAELYPDKPRKRFSDPRSRFDKLVLHWLRATQRNYGFHAKPNYGQKLYQRSVRKVLRPLGW